MPDDLREHPLLTGIAPTSLCTAENPKYPTTALGGNKELAQDAKSMGMGVEPAQGKYGVPENSFVLHGGSLQQAFDLGHRYGQEAVVHSEGGKRWLLFTHGPNMGKAYAGVGVKVSHEEPPDYFTKLGNGSFVQLQFADDKLVDLLPFAGMNKHEVGFKVHKMLVEVLAGIPTG